MNNIGSYMNRIGGVYLIQLKKDLNGKYIGECSVCGNQDVFVTGAEASCFYCQEYASNATKYKDEMRIQLFKDAQGTDKALLKDKCASYEGRIYNNMQIQRVYYFGQYKVCDLICLWESCKKLCQGVDLATVVKRMASCSSAAERLKLRCNHCKHQFVVRSVDFYYDEDTTCPKCHKTIQTKMIAYNRDMELYVEFKAAYLAKTYGYVLKTVDGHAQKDSGVPNILKVASIWNTRHLVMTTSEAENTQFQIGGKVESNSFNTDVVWGM